MSDHNECKDLPCHVNASCINTLGSFYCVCNDGYFGDGFECKGIPYIIARIDIIDYGNITDVNECTKNSSACEDVCMNTIGSFFCTCPNFGQGFKADGTQCVGKFHRFLNGKKA